MNYLSKAKRIEKELLSTADATLNKWYNAVRMSTMPAPTTHPLYDHQNFYSIEAAKDYVRESFNDVVKNNEASFAAIVKARNLPPLKPQEISVDVLLEKYAESGETSADDIHRRVAVALSVKDNSRFRRESAMALKYFIPAGRINASAGVGGITTLLNCFVQEISDSATEVTPHAPTPIYTALGQAAETMRRGGGVGYNFSKIRPRGALVKGTNSDASGPVSYLSLFDASCGTIKSAGDRRGAQMGVLNCDHPDIFEFISAKRSGGITNFNLSVLVSDEMMGMIQRNKVHDENGTPRELFPLIHEAAPKEPTGFGTVYKERKWGPDRSASNYYVYDRVDPEKIYDAIMESTYNHAEPGVLFGDTINRNNNLNYIEYLDATNPCAEQPLPNNGCCDLGSINLAKLVQKPFTPDAQIDWTLFGMLIYFSVRMLDNVLDVSNWPHEAQRKEAMAKRRIGLGFTGLGNALAMLQIPYDSQDALDVAELIAGFMQQYAYISSAIIGEEKGSFELYDQGNFFSGKGPASRAHAAIHNFFYGQRPVMEKDKPFKIQMRNSHLLSIAPTGTISLAFADNASNGVEPPFSYTYTRKKLNSDGTRSEYIVEDYAYRLYRYMFPEKANEPLPPYFRNAMEISAKAHLDMVIAISPYICTAISKTINVPEDYPYEDFKNLYFEAWKSGTLKGVSTYRPNRILGSVLSVIPEKKPEEPAAAATIKEAPPANNSPEEIVEKEIDEVLAGTYVIASPSANGATEIPMMARPVFADGNMCRTFDLRGFNSKLLVTIGYREIRTAGGDVMQVPFEILATGNTENALGAVLKNLSIDIRNGDWNFVQRKLEAIVATVSHVENVEYMLKGKQRKARSYMHAISTIINHEIGEIRSVSHVSGDYSADLRLHVPVNLTSMIIKVPARGRTTTHTVSIPGHSGYPAFDIHMSKCLINGELRIYRVSSTLSTSPYMSALMAALSMDALVENQEWFKSKLAKCVEYSEADSAVFAPSVDGDSNNWYKSMVGLHAEFILDRINTMAATKAVNQSGTGLGAKSKEAFIDGLARLIKGAQEKAHERTVNTGVVAGKECGSCGAHAVIRVDGCNRCTACGEIGSCG